MTLITRAHAVVLAVVAASLLGGHAQAQVPDRAGSGGTLVWEDVFIEGATPVNDLYILNAVDTEGRRVFAAGSGPYHDGPTISPFVIIRAHDADTGTLLWQTTRVERNEVLAGFGIGDGRVFAAGGGRSGFCRLCFNAFFVRAYDSATGSVLWEERLGQCQNQPGDCPDPVRATDLASDEGRVVVGLVAARAGRMLLASLTSRWVAWVQIGLALLIVGVGLVLTANATRLVATLR